MIDRDFTALRQIADRSIVWTVICSAGRVLQHAWTDSRMARAVDRVFSTISATPVGGRIRVGAATIAWAAAAYGAGLAIAPPYVRPGVPVPVFFGFAVLAAIVSASADRFARAWPDSAIRAALRK